MIRMADHGESNDGDIEAHAQYDGLTTSPSTTVIDATARVTNDGPPTFEPLYENVDPDARDTLVQASITGPMSGEATVSVSVANRQGTVHCSGAISIRTKAL